MPLGSHIRDSNMPDSSIACRRERWSITSTTSLEQLAGVEGYRPAALVLTRVVSHPAPDRITVDAGHKAVSADAGVPTCAVLGRPDLKPLKPSEEHLPIEVAAGAPKPAIGEILYLIPRHVCPDGE